MPVVLTLFAASQFLHAIPTAGNDIVLEAVLGLPGAGLEVAAGLATNASRLGSLAFAKAGAVAAILWVLGIGARMGFSMWVTYGGHAASPASAPPITAPRGRPGWPASSSWRCSR